MDKMMELFGRWRGQLAPSEIFVEDGFINKDAWDKAPLKILFVLKEVNDKNKKLTNITSHIERAITNPKSKLWKRPTFHNVGRWAYGLRNCYADTMQPSYKDAHKKRKDSLLSCAFINVKKTAGGRTATDEVEEHTKKFAGFIREQIQIISPDIIVFGGTYRMMKDHVFKEMVRIAPRVHSYQNTVCINANHPACTIERRAIYDQVVANYHAYLTGSNDSQLCQ